MNIEVTYGQERRPSSVLLVDYFEDCPPEYGERFPAGDPFYELVRPIFESGDFSGKWKQNVLVYTSGKITESRIMLVGLGSRQKLSPFQIKVSFGHALKKLRDLNITEVATFIDKQCNPEKIQRVVEYLVEAAYLSQYSHPNYKKEAPTVKNIEKLHFIVPAEFEAKKIEAGVEEGTVIGHVVNEVRDLVNKPSNYMTPTHLANQARKIARENPSVSCEIFEKDRLTAMGMGGILSVGKGSKEPPYLIQCTYTPEAEGKYKTIALVGKGITFDSGGISIKPSAGMYRMKDDMAGAALALGILQIAAKLKLPMKIMALVPTCENMPGGDALKPGDIITAFDKTTVEVLDTDAEGRLILMDGLAYAASQKADLIIDMATLTGACTIALGRYVIGGFTNYQPMMDLMKQSGDYIYERVWQLPLMPEYKLQLKSLFADISNYGGREAGVVTAAVFLNHFVGKTPWIHLDIAGVTWYDAPTSLIPEGASGIGVRLVIDFLRRLCTEKEEIWTSEAYSVEDTIPDDEVSVAGMGHHHRKYLL